MLSSSLSRRSLLKRVAILGAATVFGSLAYYLYSTPWRTDDFFFDSLYDAPVIVATMRFDDLTLVDLQDLKADAAYGLHAVGAWGIPSNETCRKLRVNGIQPITRIPGTRFYETGSAVLPRSEWWTRPNGNPVESSNETGSNGYAPLTNPRWVEIVSNLGKKAVGNGVLGIEFDEVFTENGNSYSDTEIFAFRQYLRDKYSPARLHQRYGIESIEEFNYRDYLVSRGYTDPEKQNFYDLALEREYTIFWMKSVVSNFERLAEQLRQIGLESNHRSTMIAENQWELQPREIALSKIVDFFSIGTGLQAFSSTHETKFGPPWYSGTPIVLLANGIDKSKAPYMFIDAPGLSPVTNSIAKILIAETYAYGGRYNLPYTQIYDTSRLWGKGPTEALKQYGRFLSGHSYLYGMRDTIANVGLLITYPTLFWNGTLTPSYGLMEVLLDNHIPFDVVFSGDGYILPDDLALERLQKYDLMILPQLSSMSSNQVRVIESYALGRGKVLAINDNATSDETGTARSDSPFSPDASNMIHLQIDDFLRQAADYQQSRDPVFRAGLDQAVRQLVKPPLETDVDWLVHANVTVNDSMCALHLVNRDYVNASDSIIERQAIRVSLRQSSIPPPPYSAHILSPDFDTNLTPELVVREGQIEVTIPRLQHYAIVLIGSEKLTDYDAAFTDSKTKIKEALSKASNPFSGALVGGRYEQLLKGAFQEYTYSIQMFRLGRIDEAVAHARDAAKSAGQVIAS